MRHMNNNFCQQYRNEKAVTISDLTKKISKISALRIVIA